MSERKIWMPRIITAFERRIIMYEEFAAWLDEKLENGLPDTAVAVNFNIYEEENNGWTVQLIASDRFDAQDDEWAEKIKSEIEKIRRRNENK